ncbi:MAG: SpoIIE family protein phosphatase [Clostridia bacterium]|nr:SpoIIE family protein phosphatase [Clostridia bacterium]
MGNLTKVVENSAEKQEKSITKVSEETMFRMLDTSMTQSTGMHAYIADNIFSEVRGNVLTLQEYAEYLYAHPEEFSDKQVSDPLPENDGKPSVQLQHEAAVDPADDKKLGLAANMSEIMLSMFQHSNVLNSCFIATVDGNIIFVDDRAGANFDTDGNLQSFEVRQRPWYKGAKETGDIYFTGIELDAFTNIPGLVCSAPVYNDGKLVAVVGADIFLNNISGYVNDSEKDGGFVCIVNQDGEIIFSPQNEGTFRVATSDQTVDLRSGENKEFSEFVTKSLRESTGLTAVTVDGTDYYLCGVPMETVGWAVISAVDKELTDEPAKVLVSNSERINGEAQSDYYNGVEYSQRFLLIMTVVILVLALTGRIVRPIEHMTRRIDEISGTDLAFEMEDTYRTNDEIEVLAEAFATLSKRTRNYIEQITKITAEKERIGAELELATRIQADMLPNIFSAFPEREEFDIYAAMTPAKEVGGDFYDFFLIDDDHLGMVMADVSGKGVPAALFMMMSKILVSNFAMMGGSPAKVLEQVNTQICKNNEEEMFVTVWFGVLEISTGKVTAANAGHEYPIIKKANGEFEI